MIKKKERAALSVICLVLCVALLAGTTYAWFSDSVSNTGNRIQAGSLDVEVNRYDDAASGDRWISIEGGSSVFSSGDGTGNLWEPGYSQYAVLEIANRGNLAFKYRVDIVSTGETEAVTGESICDEIGVYVRMPSDRTSAEQTAAQVESDLKAGKLSYIGTLSELMADGDGAARGVLAAHDSAAYATVVLKMNESAGNAFQNLSAGFDIKVSAAQYTYEKDGFGNDQYDAGAGYDKKETADYLKFTANTDNSTVVPSFKTGTYSYSTDGGKTWTEGANDGTTVITLSHAGDSVMLKGRNCTTSYNRKRGEFYKFAMTGSISAAGSVTSLTDECGKDPDVKLSNRCYSSMFADCSALTSAPSLPAVNLETLCYAGMFSGCTSLASAPELPASEMADGCYSMMFMGCTALKTAPALNSVSLAAQCYMAMFEGSGLTSAPALPASVLKEYCYCEMFCSCTGLAVPADLTHVTDFSSGGCSKMFMDCSALRLSDSAGDGKMLFFTAPADTSSCSYMFMNVEGIAYPGTPSSGTAYYYSTGD